MPTDHIVSLLIEERDRLNRAIEALQGPAKRRGRPPAKTPSRQLAEPAEEPPTATRKPWTAAQKKAASASMKKRWATKKKAAS
jgi:hypothetical protein